MIKKLIKCIMILCGSVVFSVAIVGCKPTTILADNSPVLKSARPTPRKVSSVQTDTIYQWKSSVSDWRWPGGNNPVSISGINYDWGNDPNDLDDPTYTMEIELDTAYDGYLDFYINDSLNWNRLALYTGSQQGGSGSEWYEDEIDNLYIRFWSVNSDIQTYVAPFLEEYDPTIRYPLYINDSFIGNLASNTRLQVVGQYLSSSTGDFARLSTGLKNYDSNQWLYYYSGLDYGYLEGFYLTGSSNVIYSDSYIFVLTGPLYLYTKIIDFEGFNDLSYVHGYEDGSAQGYNEGYDDGLADNSGYQQGLEQSGKNVLRDGWQAIFQMVSSFFDLEIFPGFKLVYMLYIALGGVMIAIAIKLWVH